MSLLLKSHLFSIEKAFQLGFTTLHCSNNWLLGDTEDIWAKLGCPNSASWSIFWIWSFTKDCFEAGKRLNAGAKLRRNKSTSSCCSSFSPSLASLVARYLSNSSSVSDRLLFTISDRIAPGLAMDVPVLVLAGSAPLSSSGSSSSILPGTPSNITLYTNKKTLWITSSFYMLHYSTDKYNLLLKCI